MDKLFDETILRIQKAPVLQEPFAHVLIHDVFPADLYAKILRHIPDALYYRGSLVSPFRRSLALDEHHLTLLELDPHLFEFWSAFQASMCGDKFLSVVLKKFNIARKASFTPAIQLIKDKDCYSIGPHTDIPKKVLTLLFYLPASLDQDYLGTSLYKPVDPTFSCPKGSHHAFEPFVKVTQAPFLPNFVFGFARTDTSFHGVEPVRSQTQERNLLTYTVWN